MARGRRRVCVTCLVVTLASGAVPVVRASQEPQGFDAARAALAAAIAAERSQAEEVTRAEARAAEAERALAEGGAEQARASRAAVERLAQVTASLSAMLDERERALLGPVKLRAEYAEIRRWYDLLLPHAAVLGPGSLRTLRFHLEELRAAQVIGPQRVDFDSFRDLQRYLADLNHRLRQAAEESAKRAEALRLQAQALAVSQGRALRDVAAGAGIDGSLVEGWRARLHDVDAARQALDDRQRAVIQAFEEYLAAGRRNAPPFVRRAVMRQTTTLYDASWAPPDRDVAPADDELRKLLAARTSIEGAIGEIESDRRALAAERLPKAESMHRQSLLLYDRAQEYRTAIWNQAIAEVVIEATTTVVEMAVTGGAATLARKASDAALQAAENAAARRALAGELEMGVFASLRGTGAKWSESELARIRAVAVHSGTFTERYVEAAERAAASRGQDVYRAGRQAAIEADRVLDKVDMSRGLLEQAAEFERAQRLALADAELFRDIARREVANVENLAGKAVPLLPAGRDSSGFREGRPQVASGLVGDGIGLVLQNAVATGQYMYGATAREFIDGDKATLVRRVRALRQSANLENVQDALKGQLRGNVVNVVGMVTKAAVSAHFGAVADDALHDFYRMFAELEMDYALYWAGGKADGTFAEGLADLRRALAEVMARLTELSARRELRRTADAALTDRNASVVVQLEFSNVLDRPPSVTLGGVPVVMSPRGQLPAAEWTGRVEAGTLAPGQAPLVIELAPGTRPWAQLDANPGTPAMPLTPQNATWLSADAGSDRHHRLRVEVAASPEPSFVPQPGQPAYSGRWRAQIAPDRGGPVFVDIFLLPNCSRAISADGQSWAYVDELTFESGRLKARTVGKFAFAHPWFEAFDVMLSGDAGKGQWFSTGFDSRAPTQWARVRPQVRDVTVQSRSGADIVLRLRGEDLPFVGTGHFGGCGDVRSGSTGVSVVNAHADGGSLLVTVRIEAGVATGTKLLLLNGFRVPWDLRQP